MPNMDVATNDALGWFDKNLREQRPMILSILTYGRWHDNWKKDLVDRYRLSGGTKVGAILSLYENASLPASGYLKHMGLYLEVTKDGIKDVRFRMTEAGFKDVTVIEDGNQRYVLGRKQG